MILLIAENRRPSSHTLRISLHTQSSFYALLRTLVRNGQSNQYHAFRNATSVLIDGAGSQVRNRSCRARNLSLLSLYLVSSAFPSAIRSYSRNWALRLRWYSRLARRFSSMFATLLYREKKNHLAQTHFGCGCFLVGYGSFEMVYKCLTR